MNEETKDPKQQAAEMSADKAEAAKATEAEEKTQNRQMVRLIPRIKRFPSSKRKSMSFPIGCFVCRPTLIISAREIRKNGNA